MAAQLPPAWLAEISARGDQVTIPEVLERYFPSSPAEVRGISRGIVAMTLERAVAESRAVQSRRGGASEDCLYTMVRPGEDVSVTWQRHWRRLAMRSPGGYAGERRWCFGEERRGVAGEAVLEAAWQVAHHDPRVAGLRPHCLSATRPVEEVEAAAAVAWGEALVTVADDVLARWQAAPRQLFRQLRRTWALQACVARRGERVLMAGDAPQGWEVEEDIPDGVAYWVAAGGVSDCSHGLTLWCPLTHSPLNAALLRPVYQVEAASPSSQMGVLAGLGLPVPAVTLRSAPLRVAELSQLTAVVVDQADCCWSSLAVRGHCRLVRLHAVRDRAELRSLPDLSVPSRPGAGVPQGNWRQLHPVGLLKPAARDLTDTWFILWSDGRRAHFWEQTRRDANLGRLLREGRMSCGPQRPVLTGSGEALPGWAVDVPADLLEPATALLVQASLGPLTLL